MKVMSLRVDEKTEKALAFLIKLESENGLRKITVSEYIRYLIRKEEKRKRRKS